MSHKKVRDVPREKVTAVGGVSFSSLPEFLPETEDAPPSVLFIGRDFYRKRGDFLLEAFALARKEYPDAQLLAMTRDPIPRHLPIDPGDVDGLASAMKKLFSDNVLRSELGKAARQRVENKFTWDRVVDLLKPKILATGVHFTGGSK